MTARSRDRTSPWQRGFLGRYALTALDRAPLYAHQLSAQISSRSQGLWQPSPGAVYPAFRSLVARGLARTERQNGHRLYFITAAGRRQLSEIRTARARWAERFGGSWRLMLDLVEPDKRAESALRRLRQAVAMGEALVAGDDEQLSPTERAHLRRAILLELEHAIVHLKAAAGPRAPRARRGSR